MDYIMSRGRNVNQTHGQDNVGTVLSLPCKGKVLLIFPVTILREKNLSNQSLQSKYKRLCTAESEN